MNDAIGWPLVMVVLCFLFESLRIAINGRDDNAR